MLFPVAKTNVFFGLCLLDKAGNPEYTSRYFGSRPAGDLS